MWKFNLITNINTALRKTEGVLCNYENVMDKEGTAECRISDYCTYLPSTLRSVLIDVSYGMDESLKGYAGYEISRILNLILQYVVNTIGFGSHSVTIFDCLNITNCSTVIGIQATPVSMKNTTGIIMHHMQQQRPHTEKSTISMTEKNGLKYTNEMFYFFGKDHTVDEICRQTGYIPGGNYWFNSSWWQLSVPTVYNKCATNYSIERQNIWQTALVPYSIDYEQITGPVCSYHCLLKKITLLAADMQIKSAMKINTKYYQYLIDDDYEKQIAQDFVHYHLTIWKQQHKYVLNFPCVLISLIAKYICLFDFHFDRKSYIWLKYKSNVLSMYNNSGYVSPDSPCDPNEIFDTDIDQYIS